MAAALELRSEMPTAALLRKAFTAGTGRVVWDGLARSLSFLLTIVLARSFGAEGYGVFAVAWYAAWMLSQVTDLGLHLATLRSLSRELHEGLVASAVAAKAALSLLAVVAAALVRSLTPISGTMGEGSRVLGYLLGAQLIGSWVELAGIVLRSRGRIAREGALLTTLRLGWLGAGIWTVVNGRGSGAGIAGVGNENLETLASTLFVSSLPALGLALMLLTRSGGSSFHSVPGAATLALVKQAFPLAATTAITLLYLRADLLLVGALRGSTEAGLFQSAFRLFEATFVLSGGIAAGTFPFLAARVGRRGFEGLSWFVFGLELGVAAPLAGLFIVFGDHIVALVYGDGFRGAAPVLAFLGAALVAVFVNAATTHLLVAAGRTGRLLFSMIVRLVVGITLDFLLIPVWGATGAAVAVAVAEWSLLAASLAWAADLFGPPVSQRPTAPEGASSC